MKEIMFVSDAFKSDTDHLRGVGGAEKSDTALIERLEKDFIVKKVLSSEFKDEPNTFKIFSNCTGIFKDINTNLSINNYMIIHHDYQFLNTRNPYIHNSFIISAVIHFMQNAKVNYFQTDFHLDLVNKIISGNNYKSLECTFFSNEELMTLNEILMIKPIKHNKFAILNNPNVLKGTNQSMKVAHKMGLQTILISPKQQRELFIELYNSIGLIFFPLSPETCCRLVLEAKCLNIPVITSFDYGVTTQEWFYTLKGNDMIKHIKEMNNNAYESIRNLINEQV